MNAFGRWFSGRRSEPQAQAPAPTPPEEVPPAPAEPADWGSRGEVELGPPPPPDAEVNPGPPTGPLPVLDDAGPWAAPGRDPVPAWARSSRDERAGATGAPPWRRPAPPQPPAEVADAGSTSGGSGSVGPGTAGTSVDAFTAWFSAGGTDPGGPATSAGTPPDSWPPVAATGARAATTDGSAASPASGPASPGRDPHVTSADESDATTPPTGLARPGGPADPAPTASAPHVDEADAPTDETPTAGRPSADPAPADVPPDEVPPGDVQPGEDPPGEDPALEAPALEAPAVGAPPPADVPPAEVPAAVAAEDRREAAAGPPGAQDRDAPVHADLHTPIALDTDLAHDRPAVPDAPDRAEDTGRTEDTGHAPATTGTHTVGRATAPDVVVDRDRLAQGRIGIGAVTPEVDGGRFPSKAVVGEVVPVTATVWREGHDAVGASVVWSRCSEPAHAAATADRREAACAAASGDVREVRMASAGPETDRFVGTLVPDVEGLWSFRVDAWSDPWATWRHAVELKEDAGQGVAELANDLESGARLLDRAATAIRERFRTGAPTPGADTGADAAPDDTTSGATVPMSLPPALALAQTLGTAATALRDDTATLAARLGPALAPAVHRTMIEQPVRELITHGRTHHVLVERARALDGAWYEFFPRSTGGVDEAGRPVHGTFATASAELDRVAAMGFDVAYLPPIHPVGRVHRKGPNNSLTPGPDDVGSPWAIGSADGGHDAIDPALGTVGDFDAFVGRARELGLEVALDFALQCAPDHPWAAEHPEWFTVRPDGTIAYAENPPKKYQDIYPVNFDVDPEGIYRESLRVLLGWIDHGVRIFRVDNPHTKPPDFWAWVIAEVHRVDPGVVFLAEAFTRPARMFGLAALGFSQSYTYFTWRTGKEEIQEFFELHRDRVDECRPNCFVNTPDILHESLQQGGPGMFALRAALAALLAPSWGVYAGFELFEDRAVREGSEEYRDSEKYQLRPRDFAGALAAGRSLEPWLARLNEIRRAHPALRQLRTLRFHEVDNPALIAFSKTDPRSGDAVVGVITLNPFGSEEGTLRLDLPALGLAPFDRFAAVDEVSGETFDWGGSNFVRLEPWHRVAHLVSVRR